MSIAGSVACMLMVFSGYVLLKNKMKQRSRQANTNTTEKQLRDSGINCELSDLQKLNQFHSAAKVDETTFNHPTNLMVSG